MLEVVDVSSRKVSRTTGHVCDCYHRSDVLLLPVVKACLHLRASESLGPTQSTFTGHRGRDLISLSFHNALRLIGAGAALHKCQRYTPQQSST